MTIKSKVLGVATAVALAITPTASSFDPSHEASCLRRFDPKEVLLGYQKRWIADESPLKIAEKSRRTGLTWAEAADAALTAGAARGQGGTNHFYVGSNKEMAREFIDAAAMWAKVFDKAAGEIQEEMFVDDGQDGKEILTFAIYFASGFKIQALSSNPSNLRGMQGNVTIDEAAFHDRLAEVLKAALAPLYALNCKSYHSHRRHPRLVFDTTEAEDLRALAYPLRAFVSMGMQIPQNWLHEKTRIPKPANGEAVLVIQQEDASEQGGETALAALAAKQPDASLNEPSQTALDKALNALTQGQMSEAYMAMVEPLLAQLQSEPEQLRVQLEQDYPNMDTEQLTETLARLMFVAELWGMANA
ncbi:phage portal protein family protein [Shewanella xiamenensis]|uniref:phage portal protein family protein n=1 Tax=Shewanella xiamenensis TaxID=332186 RepID=UPI00313CEBA8